MKKFLIYLLIITIIGGGLFYFVNSQMKVSSGTIEVFRGATPKQIGGILEQNELVKNGDIFYAYIRLKQEYYRYVKKDPGAFIVAFKEGKFDIKSGNFDYLIEQLNEDGFVEQNNIVVTIPEGSTVVQMSDILGNSGLFTSDEFLAYVNDKNVYEKLRVDYDWLPLLNPKVYYPLEGYLHANTYHLPESSSPESAVKMMLEETNRWHAKNLVHINKIINETTLNSFSDIVILASIVERESKFDEDRPKVAQVFYNRLKSGMKLESDITAAYGNREHKVFMYYSDIAEETPYNTYKIKGLPAGAIGSPSLNSLSGVIKPMGEDFKAIYFYARPSGETFYANTFKKHEQNRKKWEHEWKKLENK